MAWWALGGSLAITIIVSTLAIYFGRDRSKLAKRVGELQGQVVDLEARILDQVALLEILAAPDPSLDELVRMSEDAARAADPAGGGLSAVESRATDRILRALAARDRGAGEG